MLASLTDRQIDVLDRVVLRMTSKEIARELGISPSTVDQRIKASLPKLGATDRSDAARRYVELNRICGRTIYGTSVMDVLTQNEDLSTPEVQAGAQATLHNSYSEWREAHGRPGPTFLEVFDRRYGRWGRAGLILALSVLMAMLALVALVIGLELNKLV